MAEVESNTNGTSEQQQPSVPQENNEAPKGKPAGGPRSLENRDAIPTAGGKKLGEEHWGESQIVPDNPKPKEDASSAGAVAGGAGQPTDEVANNTAMNTGGATGGPQGAAPGHDASDATGEEKKGFAEKIKDKLPFGKKSEE